MDGCLAAAAAAVYSPLSACKYSEPSEFGCIDNSEVMSFNLVKEAIHSSLWKGTNGPKCFQNVLNVRPSYSYMNALIAYLIT